MKNHSEELVQPLCLKTSLIIEYSNQPLTQRLIPQLHQVRKLSLIPFQRKSQFQPWESELLDTKNRSSIMLSQKTVVHT